VTGSIHASHCATQPINATVTDNYAPCNVLMILVTRQDSLFSNSRYFTWINTHTMGEKTIILTHIERTDEINTDGRVTHDPVEPFAYYSVVKTRHAFSEQKTQQPAS